MRLVPPPPTASRLILSAPSAGADLAELCARVRQLWHLHLHAHAGRWRVTEAQLLLGPAWMVAVHRALDLEGQTATPAALRRLVDQWSAVGIPRLTVCARPALAGAELRLHWAPWHAPPARGPNRAARIAPAPSIPFFSAAAAQPAPAPQSQSSGVFAMISLPRWMSPTVPADIDRHPTAPALSLERVPAPPQPVRQQLPQVLGSVAHHVLNQERAVLDDMECRYELRVLTFWVNADSQPALRTLMDLNQKSPAKAREFVERSFAKHCPDAMQLLNTSRLKLEFKPGEAMPRGVSEVLAVGGRESVVLRFNWEGDIDLGPSAPAAGPAAPAVPRATRLADPEAVHPAAPMAVAQATDRGAALVLWTQWPDDPALHRWRFDPADLAGADAIWVGADPDAPETAPEHCLRTPDLNHISARHLKLVPPTPTEQSWQVVDTSTNRTAVFNPHEGGGERTLAKGESQALPASGVLRLAPFVQRPVLLHFSQAPVRPAAVAPTAIPMRPARRVTELAVLPPSSGVGV